MTLANQLTLLRIALVPGLVILVVYAHFGWALTVFAIAGVTDGLDGLAARVRSERTELGAMLDPLADKLLVTASLIVLSVPNPSLAVRIPAWIAIVSISRDALILLAVLVFHLAIGRRSFTPTFLGKATTVAHLVMILIVLWGNYRGEEHPFTVPAFAVTMSLVALSGIQYLYMGHDLLKDEPG
ncbi:MAG TPA: CDP-alcohol phosphatidyltransferase family protein [Vicinamibacteria bacterium]|nr:CDP-alcohol phosphatidyltransferase family protein [Vicinamibacteria bacterium]